MICCSKLPYPLPLMPSTQSKHVVSRCGSFAVLYWTWLHSATASSCQLFSPVYGMQQDTQGNKYKPWHRSSVQCPDFNKFLPGKMTLNGVLLAREVGADCAIKMCPSRSPALEFCTKICQKEKKKQPGNQLLSLKHSHWRKGRVVSY